MVTPWAGCPPPSSLATSLRQLLDTNDYKAHVSRKLIPDSIIILSETFLAHFVNSPLLQIKKQFTVTLKFGNERLSKYYLQHTNVTI